MGSEAAHVDDDAGRDIHNKIRNLLDVLFDEGTAVYRGYVDDPRNTDNAWFETTAFHFHCPLELGALLTLSNNPRRKHGPPGQRFLDVTNEIASPQSVRTGAGPLAARLHAAAAAASMSQHGSGLRWLNIDRQGLAELTFQPHIVSSWVAQMEQRVRMQQKGLTHLVVHWGRRGRLVRDVAEKIFADPELIEHRGPAQIGPAFQAIGEARYMHTSAPELTHVALAHWHGRWLTRHALSARECARTPVSRLHHLRLESPRNGHTPNYLPPPEPSQEALALATDPAFDIGLVNLLLSNGATASSVHLPSLFKTSMNDPYSIFSEMSYLRAQLQLRREKKRRKRTFAIFVAARAAERRASSERRTTTRMRGTSRERTLKNLLPSSLSHATASVGELLLRAKSSLHMLGDGFKDLAPAAFKARSYELHDTEAYPLSIVAGSPWTEEQVPIIGNYINGFCDYARAQKCVTTFDLLVWAVLSGADELAHALWCRSGSPLRTALIAHEMCQRLLSKHTRRQQLIALAARFSQSAIGVLDRLPSQEIARKILLAREDLPVIGPDGKPAGVDDKWTTAFAMLGGRHGSRSSLLDIALEFQNKEFLAHRYCQVARVQG